MDYLFLCQTFSFNKRTCKCIFSCSFFVLQNFFELNVSQRYLQNFERNRKNSVCINSVLPSVAGSHFYQSCRLKKFDKFTRKQQRRSLDFNKVVGWSHEINAKLLINAFFYCVSYVKFDSFLRY